MVALSSTTTPAPLLPADMKPPVQRAAASPWPAIRSRARGLASEVYAETIGEVVAVVQRAFPPPSPGELTLGARLANTLIAAVAVFVAFIGRLEGVLIGVGGLPVREVREATPNELRQGAGALSDRRLLPSAYEVWVGPRSEGYLRLRYSYDVARLGKLLEDAVAEPSTVLVPLNIDEEIVDWVRQRVTYPAPGTQLAVWRALKRRLYHYDAGVVAFYGFPRNFLLSAKQWTQLFEGRARKSNKLHPK